MRQYRRGWLAKAIGDKVAPDDELMVVLTVRKRMIEGFGMMIARGAAQLALSRPTTPPSSPDTEGNERKETADSAEAKDEMDDLETSTI